MKLKIKYKVVIIKYNMNKPCRTYLKILDNKPTEDEILQIYEEYKNGLTYGWVGLDTTISIEEFYEVIE